MPTTTAHALRYPAPTDPADVPSDMQKLASDVDTALLPSNVVCNATTRLIASLLTPSDSQAVFSIRGDGAIYWGAGGSSPLDTVLYRKGPRNLLTSAGLSIAGSYLYIRNDADTQWRATLSRDFVGTDQPALALYGSDGNEAVRLSPYAANGPGLMLTGLASGSFDTYLWRGGYNTLRTTSQVDMSNGLGPKHSTCMITQPGVQPIPNGAWTYMAMNGSIPGAPYGGDMQVIGYSGAYHIRSPVAGIFLLTAYAQWAIPGGSTDRLFSCPHFNSGNAQINSYQSSLRTCDNSGVQMCSWIIAMNANDFVGVTVWQNSGATLNLQTGNLTLARIG